MKILFLANSGRGLYKFRKELIEKLLFKNNDVYISLPNDEFVPKLIAIGCKFIDTPLERRGTNFLTDVKLLRKYIDIIKTIEPDIVLTYTIKPNVYGGIACRIMNTKYITNITGLGTAVENKSIIQNITLYLYKVGLKKASCVFFQNSKNQNFFVKKKVSLKNMRLIPGSGVNLEEFKFEMYPSNTNELIFLFIGRIMKAKGIEELFEASNIIKSLYPEVKFHILGSSDENYLPKLKELEKDGVISYFGQQSDVRSYIKNAHAIILPSYHEGMANVLLESASSGRPILASRVPGCIETFDEGISGISFDVKNIESLVKAIISFIELPYEEKIIMGTKARFKMEKEYDRNKVIASYLEEIKRAGEEESKNGIV